MVHRDCPDHRHQIDKSRWRLIKGSKMPFNLLQLNCRTFLFDSLFLNESNSIKRENHPHKQISNTHRSLFGCSLFSYSVVSSPSSFSSSSPYNITVVLQQHSTWACVCCHFDRWDHVCAPSIFDCVACASVRLCVCVSTFRMYAESCIHVSMYSTNCFLCFSFAFSKNKRDNK